VDLPALMNRPLRAIAAGFSLVLAACQSASISFPNARLDANDREKGARAGAGVPGEAPG
jgi:hypothetical protein